MTKGRIKKSPVFGEEAVAPPQSSPTRARNKLQTAADKQIGRELEIERAHVARLTSETERGVTLVGHLERALANALDQASKLNGQFSATNASLEAVLRDNLQLQTEIRRER